MTEQDDPTADEAWRENFLSPTGDFHMGPTSPGEWFGNRGKLHGDDRRRVRPWQSPRWLACRTYALGPPNTYMSVGHHTEVFFHDEATALAAGHRPCFQCRRNDASRFRSLFRTVRDMDGTGVDAMDQVLHTERLNSDGTQRTFTTSCDLLPDGAFVTIADEPWVVVGSAVHHWSPTGYDTSIPRPTGDVNVLTPACTIDVLRAGFTPEIIGI
jgi:hypothetical protein